ncbi:MAG: hypothetical protein IT483_14605 [Gammaproteobacteria bacterium]|nr:hypothetical protein [Gammaproteobacteria bacterium]
MNPSMEATGAPSMARTFPGTNPGARTQLCTAATERGAKTRRVTRASIARQAPT